MDPKPAARLLLAAGVLAVFPASAGASMKIAVLVQDQDGNPVEDAIVFAHSKGDGAFPAPLHPSTMDQINKQFVPHVLAVQAGTKVRFPNKDNIHHHLYSFSPAKTFDLPLYKGEPADPVLFDKAGVVKLGCNIHDWMSGIILVLPNPYFAKTDAEGKAVVEVPDSDKVELAVFHERLKGEVEATRKSVSRRAGSASWSVALKPARRNKAPPIPY